MQGRSAHAVVAPPSHSRQGPEGPIRPGAQERAPGRPRAGQGERRGAATAELHQTKQAGASQALLGDLWPS
eukprot:15435753-Alexandrium_andersonii.AAC.1